MCISFTNRCWKPKYAFDPHCDVTRPFIKRGWTGKTSALRSVYKSAKSFFSLSILLIAQLRYQILIFLEMKLKITLVVIAVFKN